MFRHELEHYNSFAEWDALYINMDMVIVMVEEVEVTATGTAIAIRKLDRNKKKTSMFALPLSTSWAISFRVLVYLLPLWSSISDRICTLSIPSVPLFSPFWSYLQPLEFWKIPWLFWWKVNKSWDFVHDFVVVQRNQHLHFDRNYDFKSNLRFRTDIAISDGDLYSMFFDFRSDFGYFEPIFLDLLDGILL